MPENRDYYSSCIQTADKLKSLEILEYPADDDIHQGHTVPVIQALCDSEKIKHAVLVLARSKGGVANWHPHSSSSRTLFSLAVQSLFFSIYNIQIREKTNRTKIAAVQEKILSGVPVCKATLAFIWGC